MDELLWKTQTFLWNHWNNRLRAISSGRSYITPRDAFHIIHGPLVSWIITNWKQYRWGQRVEKWDYYIIIFLWLTYTANTTAPNRPHLDYHLSVHCTQYNTNDINGTTTVAVSADTILYLSTKYRRGYFSFGETFTIKRYDLYRMVKRVVTRTSIKLRVKTKWTYTFSTSGGPVSLSAVTNTSRYTAFLVHYSATLCFLFCISVVISSRCIIPIVVLFVTTWL